MTAMADTSTSTLSVYVGLHVALVPVVMDSGVLSLGHVMMSEKARSWIPMLADPQKALERAKCGAEELGDRHGNVAKGGHGPSDTAAEGTQSAATADAAGVTWKVSAGG